MAPFQPTEDYYAVLEIDQSADSNAVKSSYHRLAKIRHPDKAQDKSTATADFQLLQKAYSMLIDPDLRRDYDRIYHTVRIVRPSTSPAATPQVRTPPAKPAAENPSCPSAPRKSDFERERRASQERRERQDCRERQEYQEHLERLERLDTLEKLRSNQLRVLAIELERNHRLQDDLRGLEEQRALVDRARDFDVSQRRCVESDIYIKICQIREQGIKIQNAQKEHGKIVEKIRTIEREESEYMEEKVGGFWKGRARTRREASEEGRRGSDEMADLERMFGNLSAGRR